MIALYSVHIGSVLDCSATSITNPFLTPCFTYASLFFVAMILAAIAYVLGSRLE